MHASRIRATVALAIPVAAALLAAPALAQHEGHGDQPAAPAAAAEKRVGDPYPLARCPISGKRLGEMGDPVVKLYNGREVRFCWSACPAKFEADLPAGLARLDEKITKDQAPLYPLRTSVVTGKPLPEEPHQFVYGNRLIRVGSEAERTSFRHHAKEYMAVLDKAVVAAQGKHYPLKTCPVSGDEFGGAMGEPVDLVVAGRLVRLCCDGCKEDVEKEPARFVALVDAARKEQAAGPDHK